jgi:hypothetical protein
MIILGFILNRMNISITGMESWVGAAISVTFAIASLGFIAFSLETKYFPVFQHTHHDESKKPMDDYIQDLHLVSQQN